MIDDRATLSLMYIQNLVSIKVTHLDGHASAIS